LNRLISYLHSILCLIVLFFPIPNILSWVYLSLYQFRTSFILIYTSHHKIRDNSSNLTFLLTKILHLNVNSSSFYLKIHMVLFLWADRSLNFLIHSIWINNLYCLKKTLNHLFLINKLVVFSISIIEFEPNLNIFLKLHYIYGKY
jgi:hypothetical protein